MEPKTLRHFLIALISDSPARFEHIRSSNTGELFFEGLDYTGCEKLIDLDRTISSLHEDDLQKIYDLLRKADVFGFIR